MAQRKLNTSTMHSCHNIEQTQPTPSNVQGCCHNNAAASKSMDHTHPLSPLLRRFLISITLTLPVLFLSPMVQMVFGLTLTIPYASYIICTLSSIVFFYGGWPFLQGFYTECKNKNLGMMTLIATAIIVAYFYSVTVVFGLPGTDFFSELTLLISVMLLGHWLEMRSIINATNALELLAAMLPQTAHLVTNDVITDVDLNTVKPHDILLIKPGEKTPADGKIIEGSSYFNEAMLTGESQPLKKTVGDQVVGGALNGNYAVKIQVQHTGKDSYLAQVIQLVQTAQNTKSQTQNLADKAAKWLTLLAISISLITFIIWLGVNMDIAFALERMVTVLVISCPCALGLAVPLVVAISTTLAAQNGLLIRNRTAFENARKVTTVVFDKTGTLTQGNFKVTDYRSLTAVYSNDDILKIAASVEQNSEHPIASSIVNLAKERHFNFTNIGNFHALVGEGVSADLGINNIKIVSPKYLAAHAIKFNPPATPATAVIVLINEQVAGLIVLSDTIREESASATKTLKKNNIKTIILSGDKKEVVQNVSETLGVDKYYAEVLPHQKLNIIKELQKHNEFVAMAGDGVNDAPALAQANIGIAIGSGTDIAAATADIVLVKNNPQDIATLMSFGKITYRKMVQNLIWATSYNVIAIPLAAGALYNFGVVFTPALGAAFMSLSSIIVALNAQLLKKQLKSM